MKTFWDANDRQELLRRIDNLNTDSRAQWGKMTVDQMLSHLVDACKMALGELAVAPKPGPMSFAPIRKAVIYWLPWPKGAPTAPELLARKPVSVEAEKAELKTLMNRLAAQSDQQSVPAHPAFGDLSRKDWGALIHRHTDHHFKQFGV